MSIAGTNKNAILSGLKTLLNGLSDFKDNVHISYRTQSNAQNHILIHLYEDVYEPETSSEDGHFINIIMSVKTKTNLPHNDTEQEVTDFVELVGKVEDLLKANYYNAGTWEDINIKLINYTDGQEKSFLWYNARMELVLRSQW